MPLAQVYSRPPRPALPATSALTPSQLLPAVCGISKLMSSEPFRRVNLNRMSPPPPIKAAVFPPHPWRSDFLAHYYATVSIVLLQFKSPCLYFLVLGLHLLNCNCENKDLSHLFAVISLGCTGLPPTNCSVNVPQMKPYKHCKKNTVPGV